MTKRGASVPEASPKVRSQTQGAGGRKDDGVAATEFSRIRNGKLERFTLDRMITILGKLDQDVEVSVNVRPRTAVTLPAQTGQRSNPGARAPAGHRDYMKRLVALAVRCELVSVARIREICRK